VLARPQTKRDHRRDGREEGAALVAEHVVGEEPRDPGRHSGLQERNRGRAQDARSRSKVIQDPLTRTLRGSLDPLSIAPEQAGNELRLER
jgi:hypothetical protein